MSETYVCTRTQSSESFAWQEQLDSSVFVDDWQHQQSLLTVNSVNILPPLPQKWLETVNLVSISSASNQL